MVPEGPYNGMEIMHLPSPVSGSAQVEIYFQTPGGFYEDFYAVQMMTQCLGSFPFGLLVQELRERQGLVYSISCTPEGHKKTGFVKIAYSVNPDQVEESLQAIDATLNALRSGEFVSDSIDGIKARRLPDLVAKFKNPGWVYGELHYRNTAQRAGIEGANGFDNIQRIMAVTKDDIVRVANKYITEDRLVVIVAPEK
jgi:predicted Zn-dependent peptidase